MVGRGVALAAALCAAAWVPAPATAGVSKFVLVNGTGGTMQAVAIRRFRIGAWQTLKSAPARGGRIAVPFKDEDCAFDIRATFDGKDAVTWSGVNLCDAGAVILNRDRSGRAWVDYD